MSPLRTPPLAASPRSPLARCASLLVACASLGCGAGDLEGTWEGHCAITSMGFEAEYLFRFNIDEVDGREIRGDAFIGDGLQELEGPLAGEKRGRNVELDLQVALPEVEDFNLVFSVDAKVSGDVMEGDCRVGAMGVRIRSDIVLERVE